MLYKPAAGTEWCSSKRGTNWLNRQLQVEATGEGRKHFISWPAFFLSACPLLLNALTPSFPGVSWGFLDAALKILVNNEFILSYIVKWAYLPSSKQPLYEGWFHQSLSLKTLPLTIHVLSQFMKLIISLSRPRLKHVRPSIPFSPSPERVDIRELLPYILSEFFPLEVFRLLLFLYGTHPS